MNINYSNIVLKSLFTIVFWCAFLFLLAQENATKQYDTITNPQSVSAEHRNGLLIFESKDQSYRFWLNMRAQVDGAYFFGEPMNPIGNGVSLRCARIGIKAFLSSRWYAELDVNFSSSRVELRDIYLMYRFQRNGLKDIGGIKIGNFKESFSMEAMTSSNNLTFIEQALVVNTFAPSYHLGAQFFYNYKYLTGFAGVHFQNISDNEVVSSSQELNKNSGIDEGVSYTGKLVVMPFYHSSNKGLHIGGAFSYRTPKTDEALPNSVHYSSRAGTTINRKKYLDTDIISNVHHSLLAGIELAGHYKNFKLQSEFIWNNVYRNNDLATEHQNGFYVFATALLFGGNYKYNAINAEYSQPACGKNWGDLELALRYDYINLNSVNTKGGAAKSYTLGVNYYASSNVKFVLNYVYIDNDRFANGNGNYYVGYDVNHNLTKNPTMVVEENGKSGDDFGFIAARIQYSF